MTQQPGATADRAPRRGRPSVTTLEAIRRASLEVLDREGMAGLTVRGVARHLGVDAPRLYTHIQDHEQLVTLAYEAAEAELDGLEWAEVDTVTGWRDGLAVYAHGLAHHLRAHRGLVELSLHRRFFPTRGKAPALVERIAVAAEADGIDPQVLIEAIMDLTGLIVGLVNGPGRRAPGEMHDQVAHDVERISVEYPKAAALLSRAISPAPRDVISTLVSDLVRRIDALTGGPHDGSA